jgi:hypothetical protein
VGLAHGKILRVARCNAKKLLQVSAIF